MNNRNDDYLGMLNVVELVWTKKQNVIANIPAAKNAFLEMLAIQKAITELMKQQSETIGGKTGTKKEIRKNMSELSTQIGQLTAAFAFSSGNEDLLIAVNYPITYYNKLRDEEVAILCSIVLEKAQNYAAELLDYGITAEMLTKLDGYITAFSSGKKANIYDIKQRKIYTRNLRDAFAAIRSILNNKLDKIMMAFQFTHPEVYQLYLEARISMPKRKAKNSTEEAGILSGIVTDKTDETPIEGAIIKLTGTNFKTETNEDGEYLFDTLPEGSYNIEVTDSQYLTKVLAGQSVKSGDETIADFVLEKTA